MKKFKVNKPVDIVIMSTVKRNVQGVAKSQVTANPSHQEEETQRVTHTK